MDAPATEQKNYLLTGKLYCGHCGSYMVGILAPARPAKCIITTPVKSTGWNTPAKESHPPDVIENAVARAITMTAWMMKP